eukprot:g73164.t1
MSLAWFAMLTARAVQAWQQPRWGYETLECCRLLPNSTFLIAMAAVGGDEAATRAQWGPTFEVYLNEHTRRLGCSSKLQLVDDDAALGVVLARGGAAENPRPDFVFLEGWEVPYWRLLAGIRPVVTLYRKHASVLYQGKPLVTSSTGGLILRHAERHLHLVDLAALRGEVEEGEEEEGARRQRGLTLCAVGPHSFAGYHIQQYELWRRGLSVEQVFQDRVVWTPAGHGEALARLRDGSCDVAFVRASALWEETARGPELNRSSGAGWTYNLNPGADEAFLAKLGREVSTPWRYREWSLAALPHVPEAVAGLVRTVLLGLLETDEASLAGGHGGFCEYGQRGDDAANGTDDSAGDDGDAAGLEPPAPLRTAVFALSTLASSLCALALALVIRSAGPGIEVLADSDLAGDEKPVHVGFGLQFEGRTAPAPGSPPRALLRHSQPAPGPAPPPSPAPPHHRRLFRSHSHGTLAPWLGSVYAGQ